MRLWSEKLIKEKKRFYIKLMVILCLLIFFASFNVLASPKIGVIYPSLYITEELASFTQSLIWHKTHEKIDVEVVNSRPDKKSLLSIYEVLKKRGINTFIIKDETIDLSFFYKETKRSDTFFSFSLYMEKPKEKNVYMVLPNYKYVIQEFVKYSEKNGTPPVCILADVPKDEDLNTIKSLLKSYKNKWILLKIDDMFTPFGIKSELIDKNFTVFIYTPIYKKAGILTQLLRAKYKDLPIVIYEDLVSPSFLSYIKEKDNIMVGGEIDPSIYKKSYYNFKNTFKKNDFLGSLYDFVKLKILIDMFEGKVSKKDLFNKDRAWSGKILFRNLRYYE